MTFSKEGKFHIGKGTSLKDEAVYRVEFRNRLTPEGAPSPTDGLGGGNELLWQLTGGTETMTAGDRFGTQVPSLEFAGSASPSFAPGVTVDSTSRTNFGCFNQSGVANKVEVTILDNTGSTTIASQELNLAANAWSQDAVRASVSGGYIRFESAEAAVCYAVVVDNKTADGLFISATEYTP